MPLPQIRISDWPSDLTEEVAVLRQEPEDFEITNMLLFEETFDDLDFFKAAIALIDNSPSFALKRYRNCPSPELD